jgi:hypothetical protein
MTPMNAPHRSKLRSIAGTVFAAAPVCALAMATGQPLITFVPLTATTLTLAGDGEAFVQYQVTNQSAVTRTFAMTPIPGVDIDTASGHCADPFVLASHQSCTLALHLVGSAMSGDIDGGPVVCIDGNPLQCSQPSAADQLHVTLVDDVVFADGFEIAPPA